MQHTKEEVRSRILEAAALEFDERGYAGASMRSIVRRAETSLGNLYRYYPNKEALFLSIVTPVLDQCIDQTGNLFAVAITEVAQNVEQMVDFVAKHSRIFRIVEIGPPEHYAAFLDRFSARISQVMERYARAHCPESLERISNPQFFYSAGQSFVSVLQLTLGHCDDREKTVRYLRELLRFQLGCFEERLVLAGENPQ